MDERPREARPLLVLVATGLGLFMIFLDATIVNVALPDIQREFDTGEQGLQWVVAAYSLTMGMFMMSAATLSDARGRRLAYISGIVLFCAASVGCGVAPSLLVLNISRGLQGTGAAVVNVASLALVGSAFTDPAAKAKAIGSWTGIAAIGLAVGPTVGGVFTDAFGWRSIFWVNPVIGAAAIALTLLFVRESRDPTERRFDWAGQALFIAGVAAITYALVEGPHSGWASPLILALLVGSMVIITTFVLVELRVTDPMMDVRVFGDRVYSTAIVTIFCVLFGIYGTMLVITQYFQNIRDYSPEEAGFLMISMTLPVIVLAPIAGRLTARRGGRRPTLIGVSLIVAGLAVLVVVGVGGSLVWTLVGLALVGGAGGLAVAPVTSVAMSSIPQDRSGMASGILSTQRALGSTAGFAIMGSVLAAVVSLTLPDKFEPYLPDEQQRQEAVDEVVEDANPRAVAALLGPGKPLSADVKEEPELEQAADDAFVEGIRAAAAVALALVIGALIAGYVIFPKGEQAMARDEVGDAVRVESDEG
jgi:EmrB/QacA subfamily drug resistance transporter